MGSETQLSIVHRRFTFLKAYMLPTSPLPRPSGHVGVAHSVSAPSCIYVSKIDNGVWRHTEIEPPPRRSYVFILVINFTAHAWS
ncbi:hypothetical protein AG1IA_06573 [Rhizoctonia solani AG-1 IA]|uniref:Uncharacterized protein n=1 Tax=Thanatephorus cucumeris (strain AG1-IA) TaxID=983506 RepID=L8WN53_THACA|nr:hypothetical protein AG1IA_06573 [Rhizoctonia solani AG-1 IA]